MQSRLYISILLLFGLFAVQKNAAAQNQPQLRITQIINMPDTAYEGAVYDSLLVVVKLTNPAGAAYVGNIGVGYLTDSVQQPRFMYHDTFPNVIFSGDSMVFRVDGFVFDPAVFREGGNVVVVWPITPVIPNDSLHLNVYFIRALGLGVDVPTLPVVSLYPNPVVSQLNVRITPNFKPEYVRIFNEYGSIVYDHKYANSMIEVGHFAAGIYYFELQFKDAIPSRQSFLKVSR